MKRAIIYLTALALLLLIPAASTGPVIRPKTIHTEEQRALLAAAVAKAQAADKAEEEAWQAIKKARDAGVLDTVLCEQTGRSRATLNRKFGPRSA